MRFRLTYVAALLLTAILLLPACGGRDSQALTSDIVAGSVDPGTTPFISLVPLRGAALKDVTAYRYMIEPKEGSASNPVNVTYRASALERRGYLTTDTATLPVFGLYAGHMNRVFLQLEFADGSIQELVIPITTPAYVDPGSVFDRPAILRSRSAGSELGFDYFFMKTSASGVVVADTDGEVRWVSPSRGNAFSSIFFDGGFLVGDQQTTRFFRIEMDGVTSNASLLPYYTNFHHNIDRGKFGLLGEVDTIIAGAVHIESVLTEFAPSGEIIMEWDFADILERYMRSEGDDPSLFVRPGVDWFHMNSAIYDPRDDSIIASSRESFVIKVDYATGDIKWIFGDPTKYWYNFQSLRAKALQLEGDGLYPIGQHALSITSGGLLMLFNNGAPSLNQPDGVPIGESRPYSAVSAYTIDPDAMTAQEAWRFDYDETILSQYCSSAYEAKGESVLVNYAMGSNQTQARLVGLDAVRNVVFDFAYQATCNAWNAEPIPLEALVIQ